MNVGCSLFQISFDSRRNSGNLQCLIILSKRCLPSSGKSQYHSGEVTGYCLCTGSGPLGGLGMFFGRHTRAWEYQRTLSICH